MLVYLNTGDLVIVQRVAGAYDDRTWKYGTPLPATLARWTTIAAVRADQASYCKVHGPTFSRKVLGGRRGLRGRKASVEHPEQPGAVGRIEAVLVPGKAG